MPITDDELDRQLTAYTQASPHIDPDTALALVREAATSARPKPRRSPKRWLTITATVAAGALALPAAAVASQLFAAQTGLFGAAGYTEVVAGDEWIDSTATDFESYVASLAPTGLPTPEGFDWQAAGETIASRYTSEPTEMQRTLLLDDYSRMLWLAWIDEWIEADRAGDSSRRATALSAMRQAPNWPGIIDSDGGCIRYVMYAWVDRLAAGGSGATQAAQALAETWGADGWDGTSREALIAEVLNECTALTGGPDVTVDDEWWQLYERALDEVSGGAAE